MEPKKIELTLKSGKKLFAWYIVPRLMPRAIICLCHGWGEHSLRYQHWAEKFVSHDFGFFSWDHLGHGQSEGKRGHIDSYDVFMEEINLAINKSNEIFPSVPVVLYGHSMGGNIVLNFALREINPFRLLIATSPWIKLAKDPPPALNLVVKILNKTLPALSLAAPLNAEGISHVPEEVEKYKTDPLNHGRMTPKLLSEVKSAGEYALKYIHKINKPLLLTHGDADPITSFDATYELSKGCSTSSFIPFKGMYHELHNETIKDEVFGAIKEWLSGNLD